MRSILPEWLCEKISKHYIFDYIFEIRIREGKPVMVNYKGSYKPVLENQGYIQTYVIANQELVNHIVAIVTKQSLYAYNNQIKSGYITTDKGFRIGICGTVVMHEGVVSTIKNITSLNIRIPHAVQNCSEKVIGFIYCNGEIKNTLIISPPGVGKTTMVRDIVKRLSDDKKINNILVVDERFEIYGVGAFDVGEFVDVISGSNKSFAFNECLKTMNPSVIATDEVSKEEDLFEIQQAIKSGVKVIATVHAENVNDLKLKKYFAQIIENKYFERIVVLSKKFGIGSVDGVFDENLRGLYLPYIL